MAATSANGMVRVEPGVKEQAEEILEMPGIPVSVVIHARDKQIIKTRLPSDTYNRKIAGEALNKSPGKSIQDSSSGLSDSLRGCLTALVRQPLLYWGPLGAAAPGQPPLMHKNSHAEHFRFWWRIGKCRDISYQVCFSLRIRFSMWPERMMGGFGSFISQGTGFFSSSFMVLTSDIVCAEGIRQYMPKAILPHRFRQDWKEL